MITREQIKAARAMLDWSQKRLAENCEDVSEPTIKLIETGKINSTPQTLGAIQKTLEDAGIEFMPQKGVRFRDNLITVIERADDDDNVFLKLLDDMYYTLKGNHNAEILFSFVDNTKTSPEALEKQLLLRKIGVNFRFLVRNNDEQLNFPLHNYRYLPEGYFLNNPTFVYGDKYAVLVSEQGAEIPLKFILINDPAISSVKRKEFEIIWNACPQPKQSKADKVYD